MTGISRLPIVAVQHRSICAIEVRIDRTQMAFAAFVILGRVCLFALRRLLGHWAWFPLRASCQMP